MKPLRLLCALLAIGLGAHFLRADAPASQPNEVTLTRMDDRVRVEIGGKLFTDYIFRGASRPYCYPILMPDGISLVRDFPEKDTPGEETDHKHQRALMFAHGDVNKIDFWNEGTSGTKFPKGLTVHDGLVETKSGPVGELRVRNRWTAPTGELIATDETTLRFRGTDDARFIDYEVTIHALPDKPLVLGDNKEGVMALRVAQWMVLPHRQGGKDWPGTGHIVTSAGNRDSDAWGKRAAWCDYFAEHNGRVYGVALFDHPKNIRHPAWWMARDYGLLAANPFGQSSFESTKEKPLPADLGNYTIPAGGALTLRYRFYFHTGDERAAKVAEHFADYAAGR
ncbi:MAG: PmoA family protein [Nibricoccus sp.]